MKKASMLWKVLVAIILAVFVGYWTDMTTTFLGIRLFDIFDLIGHLFLNALTLLVVPLIASSVISGIGQMGQEKSFRKLGLKTFGFYVLTIFLAVLIGVLVMNLFNPGLVHKETVLKHTSEILSSKPPEEVPSLNKIFVQIAERVIPSNILFAASQGNMLGIIFFSILFGFALIKVDGTPGQTLLNFWKGTFHVLMKLTHFVMKAMPIGVFCLVAKVIASQGVESIQLLFYFFLTVLTGLILYTFIVLPLLLRISGINPFHHLRAVFPALITAFSTSSSAATLPITLECMEKRAGVSNRISSFVLPLGTSMNMSGSALYECVAVLFIAQAFGLDLSIGHQIIIALLSLMTSMGVAGVPSGSLVAIIIILNTLGLPAEGLSLILPLDRLLDMCRTTSNVYSDSSCAALVAHFEGENILRTHHK